MHEKDTVVRADCGTAVDGLLPRGTGGQIAGKTYIFQKIKIDPSKIEPSTTVDKLVFEAKNVDELVRFTG